MADRVSTRGGRRNGGRRRTRRFRLRMLWPSRRRRRGWWRAFGRAPGSTRAIIAASILLAVALGINWVYQVARKPTELFFPVSGALYKTPGETWHQYAPLFNKYATRVMTPELLAAIAQVEGSGNPLVRTYWRWSWTSLPFEIYRPASSAVGMYQITDGTFAEARRLCIHDHAVAEDGPWNDWHSCWFNGLYARVFPGDAIELTSAYLDRSVGTILERSRRAAVPLGARQELAALIHLCGAGAGEDFARRGFHLLDGQRCGDHEARAYLNRVNMMKGVFAGLAERSR
jgi:hypothetical protein